MLLNEKVNKNREQQQSLTERAKATPNEAIPTSGQALVRGRRLAALNTMMQRRPKHGTGKGKRQKKPLALVWSETSSWVVR